MNRKMDHPHQFFRDPLAQYQRGMQGIFVNRTTIGLIFTVVNILRGN